MQSREMVRRTIVMILIKWRRKEIGVGREYGCPCEGPPLYYGQLSSPPLCYVLKALTSPRGSNVLSVHYCSITTARPWRMHRFEFILFCEHRSQAMISQVVVLTKRQIDTIWASGDSLWYPVLDEVGHDDEVDGPVARVEQEEHEGEDVGGGAIEAQLEPSQLCLKIHRIQSKTIFGDQVILKHIISVLQLKWMLECVHCPAGW